MLDDTAYRNARRNSDAQNARIEHDAALRRLITSMVRTNAELYKAYTDNPSFQSWINDQVFRLTYPNHTSEDSTIRSVTQANTTDPP